MWQKHTRSHHVTHHLKTRRCDIFGASDDKRCPFGTANNRRCTQGSIEVVDFKKKLAEWKTIFTKGIVVSIWSHRHLHHLFSFPPLSAGGSCGDGCEGPACILRVVSSIHRIVLLVYVAGSVQPLWHWQILFIWTIEFKRLPPPPLLMVLHKKNVLQHRFPRSHC